MSHSTESYSKEKKIWNYRATNGWVGGHYLMPNLSQGYHGIQKQWWDFYHKGQTVLLVTELKPTMEIFKKNYPQWKFENIDYYPELDHSSASDCDIFGNLCETKNPLTGNKYSLIINQATLEHLYDPVTAMRNLIESLSSGGIIVTHTHPPAMPYHSYPRDYFRFMKDWWYDLPKYIPKVELLEFYMHENLHVFTCYRKI